MGFIVITPLASSISGTVAATQGGTGQSAYTSGDILYSSATNVLSKLAKGSDTQVLTLASGVPSWAAASSGTSLKQYVGGTSYTNGTPGTSATGWTEYRSVFVPYQTSDGAWRLLCNATGAFAAQSSTSTFSITIAGVTFKNVANFYQSVLFLRIGGSVANLDHIGYVSLNSNTVNYSASANCDPNTTWAIQFDVELNGKPTWAD